VHQKRFYFWVCLHLFAFKVTFSQGILVGWNLNHHKNNLYHSFYYIKNSVFVCICLPSKLYSVREYWLNEIQIIIGIIYNICSIIETILIDAIFLRSKLYSVREYWSCEIQIIIKTFYTIHSLIKQILIHCQHMKHFRNDNGCTYIHASHY